MNALRRPVLEKGIESGFSGGGMSVPVARARRRVVRAIPSAGAARSDLRGVDAARLEYFLSEWAYWMTKGGGVRGYGGRTPGFVNARANSSFDDMCEDMDACIIQAVDAVIRGLVQHEQDAIWKAYGVLSVWRYARLDPVKVLEDATRHVGEALVYKGIPV